MQIVRHSDRCGFVEAQKVGDGALERLQAGRALQVADVLAHKDLAANAQRDCVLEQRPHCQDGGQRSRRHHRQRGIAARPAQKLRQAVDEPQHAVVDVAGDRPIMHQEQVGNRTQPIQRLPLIGADRLIAQIAAGRHQRAIQRSQQQVVQRRRRQHDTQVWVARRNPATHGGVWLALRQHDRRGCRCQQTRLPLRATRTVRAPAPDPAPSRPTAWRGAACGRAAAPPQAAFVASTIR
jgi:hypothetical protein